MGIPDTLRICGFDYRVDRPPVVHNGEKVLCGTAEYDKLTLNISTAYPRQLQDNTLLHEAIHAIDIHMETELTESQVARLEIGLAALLRDNPALVRLFLTAPGVQDDPKIAKEG